MKKDNEKINKFKELYNKYKEAKKDPIKKAGMKLLGYLIFFLILILVANITNEIEKNNKPKTTTTTTTTKIIDSYVEKQNDLLTKKYNVNYEIKYNEKEYKINGTIENNILKGYLEFDNNIDKIVLKNGLIYELNNDIENTLEVEFDIKNLNLKDIINTVKQSSAFIKEKDNIKTYLYELDTKKIYIESIKEQIVSIKIEEENNIYTMNFDK